MASVKQGVDKRGRKYLIVDGKHVAAGDTPNPQQRKTANAHVTAAPKEAIRKFLTRWFGSAHSGEEVKGSIKQLLNTKFNLWFSVLAKTSVGRAGRNAAARMMLKRLGDQTNINLLQTPTGDLDYDKFVNHLREKHGIEVEGGGSDGSTPKPAKNDDAEILRIVHSAGIDASRLRSILKSYKKSNSPKP